MSTAAPVRAHPETASQIAPCATSSVAKLVRRLAGEVDATPPRIPLVFRQIPVLATPVRLHFE